MEALHKDAKTDLLKQKMAAVENDKSVAVTKMEKEGVEKAVKDKVETMQKAKVKQDVAKEFIETVDSPAFQRTIADEEGPLANRALADLKASLLPSYLALAAAAAKSKIDTEKRIKKEELVAKMDKELAANIAAKTDAARLHKLVTAKLEHEMKSRLADTIHKETVEALENAGLVQKLKDTVRNKYMKGTLKTSKAYVLSHLQSNMKATYDKEAEDRAKQEAAVKAQPEVVKAMEVVKKELVDKLTQEGAEALEDAKAEATEMSKGDSEKIEDELTKSAQAKIAKEADLQAKTKIDEVTAKIKEGLYEKELPKEQERSAAKLKAAIEAKTKEVADASIQQKIDAELGKAEDISITTPKVMVATDASEPKTVTEKDMVKTAAPEVATPTTSKANELMYEEEWL